MKNFSLALFLAITLGACADPLPPEQAVEFAKRCTDAGMLPWIQRTYWEGEPSRVSCLITPTKIEK